MDSKKYNIILIFFITILILLKYNSYTINFTVIFFLIKFNFLGYYLKSYNIIKTLNSL